MKKKEYSVHIEDAGEGLNVDLPGDMESLGLIQKVTRELEKWQKQNDKRAFFLIAISEKEGDDNDNGRNMAVGSGGDDKDLALMMHGAMNANKDLQKALYGACKLQEITDIDNGKQFN